MSEEVYLKDSEEVYPLNADASLQLAPTSKLDEDIQKEEVRLDKISNRLISHDPEEVKKAVQKLHAQLGLPETRRR